MSKLDELIRELCPDGVIFVPLGEVLKNNNASESIEKKDYKEFGRIPIIDQSQAYIAAYTDNESAMPPILPCIIFGDHTRIVKYAKQKFAQGDSGTKVFIPVSNDIDTKFIYYAFCNLSILSRGYNRHWSVVKELRIPLPPLPVQREIVRILDSFTELTAELTTELTARKKQYEYYRSALLDSVRGNSLETTMGEELTFLNGRAYKQEELLQTGKYPVLRVGNFYSNTSWYYSDLELDENKYCASGDLLYSWAATLGPQIWAGEKCIFHYHIWRILFDHTKIDKHYLYYYLQHDLERINRSTTKSTMIHVSMARMKERILILPTLTEQRRIASLIRSFDSLCNDIDIGLPAEIESRRKQYEYYRDRLLSFQNLGG